MKKIQNALKTINYRLWLALILVLLMPTIYKTVRVFFLGNLPDDWGFNIASQLQWVDLFYEVIQEALILPLFFILGKAINDKDDLANKLKSGLLITFIVYSVLSIVLICFARPLIIYMAQDTNLIEQTVTYIRLETIASLFGTLFQFLMIAFITIKKDKNIYILLFIQMLLSIILDTFLVSSLNISLNLGVNGIAITNIIVNIILIIVSIILLNKENIKIINKNKLQFKWMKQWFNVGKYSGLESLLRNLAFTIMIVRMVNVVGEQGNYWIANNFIWGWLLIPSLALADLVKQEIAADKQNIANKTFGYLVLTSILAILWILSIFLWQTFLKYVMNVESYKMVYKIVLIQTIFYITFMFNNSIFDATFYACGKTNYMLYQSIAIDFFYYGIMFILYLTKIFVPTIISISLMFGIGMLLDFIPTLILYIKLLKDENIKINFNV